MSDHYSDEFEPNGDGWWNARCVCGWSQGGVFPTAEDACDALMDHAYNAGRAEVVAAVSSSPGEGEPRDG